MAFKSGLGFVRCVRVSGVTLSVCMIDMTLGVCVSFVCSAWVVCEVCEFVVYYEFSEVSRLLWVWALGLGWKRKVKESENKMEIGLLNRIGGKNRNNRV